MMHGMVRRIGWLVFPLGDIVWYGNDLQMYTLSLHIDVCVLGREDSWIWYLEVSDWDGVGDGIMESLNINDLQDYNSNNINNRSRHAP